MLDLTDEDRVMLRYFQREKGDMTRWVGWERVQPILQERYPELLKAQHDLEVAEKTLDAIVRGL